MVAIVSSLNTPSRTRVWKMDVQVEPAAEALDHGEGARVAIAYTVLPDLAAVEFQKGPDEDAEDGAAEVVVPGEPVAQAVGEAQHPLADRDVRQHAVHEARGALGHASAAAARAEAAPRNSCSANWGRPAPSARWAASRRKVSRWARTTVWRTPRSASRGLRARAMDPT